MFENNVVSPEKKQHLWKNGNHTFTIYRHNPKLTNETGLKVLKKLNNKNAIGRKVKTSLF